MRAVVLIVLAVLLGASPAWGQRQLAEQGYAFAQYLLGVDYTLGTGGVPQDYAEAVKWHRLAADQGYGPAQYQLGLAYRDGWGVPQQDYAEAVKWFRKTIAQGGDSRAFAQFQLGLLYAYGQGVPRDDVLAYMWLNLAAAGSMPLAPATRNRVAARMIPDQIAEAQRLAREWRPREP